MHPFVFAGSNPSGRLLALGFDPLGFHLLPEKAIPGFADVPATKGLGYAADEPASGHRSRRKKGRYAPLRSGCLLRWREPCREHQTSIVVFRSAMITVGIGLVRVRPDHGIESIGGVSRLPVRGAGRFGPIPRVRRGRSRKSLS